MHSARNVCRTTAPKKERAHGAPRWWAGLLLLTAAFAAGAAEHVAVQLGGHPGFEFAGYYLARERGYYREAGLDVELRPGGPGAARPVDAVARGQANFGVGNAGLAIDRMAGARVVALAAVLQSSPAVWVATGRRDPLDLAAWRDLPRRLPVGEADASELVIALGPRSRAGLEGAGAHGAGSAGAAGPETPTLQASQLSTEPFRRRARNEEHSVLDPRDHGVDFYSGVLFTSEDFAHSQAGTVARFRAATLRGWAEAFADVEQTSRLVHEHYATGSSLEALVYEGQVLKTLARTEAVELGHMSRSRWEAIARLQREHGFGAKPLDVERFVHEPGPVADLRWPDPVRVTLAGLLAALMLSCVQLLRINGRLIRENSAAKGMGQKAVVAELRFQFLMEVAPFPIALYELASGTVLYANDRALTWADCDDMAGRRIDEWIPGLAPREALAKRLLDRSMIRDEEVELPAAPDGTSRWCALSLRAIEYDGKYCGFLAVRDITARKRAEREVALLSEQRALMLKDAELLQARLREASIRDPLTGLHNRRYFEATVEREFLRCRRDGTDVGLLVIDADHFKLVNDRYGHAGGDAVLRALASTLAHAFRAEDAVCRHGGEEFVVLMPGVTAEVANARAKALVDAVAHCEVRSANHVIRITISIGAVVCDPRQSTPARLLKQADAALYAAKAAGRNRVVFAAAAEPSRSGQTVELE